MINAAIVGLGRWGQTLVASVQGKSERLRFTTAVTRNSERSRDFLDRHALLPVRTDEMIDVVAAVDGIALAGASDGRLRESEGPPSIARMPVDGEGAPPRLHSRDERCRPFCPVPDRLSAYRRRPHGAVQLAVRPPSWRHLSPAH